MRRVLVGGLWLVALRRIERHRQRELLGSRRSGAAAACASRRELTVDAAGRDRAERVAFLLQPRVDRLAQAVFFRFARMRRRNRGLCSPCRFGCRPLQCRFGSNARLGLCRSPRFRCGTFLCGTLRFEPGLRCRLRRVQCCALRCSAFVGRAGSGFVLQPL